MDSYVYSSIKDCVEDFDKLLDSKMYINKKRYEHFIEQNKDILIAISSDFIDAEDDLSKRVIDINNNGYKIVEKRNKIFIDEKLKEFKDYFDNMFKGIDDSIVLDDEQRKAIIIDEDYSLVIAGAGSGKTTTMAAKVKYLIEKCGVSADKIILLAFTKKAASELSLRINEDFKLNVEVMTFHKLGMSFIRKLFGTGFKVIKDGSKYNVYAEYVKHYIFPNKDKLKEFITLFSDKVNFNDDVLSYDDFDDYFKSYVEKIYELNKDNLPGYIEERTKSRLKNHRTIDGQYLKSIGEVKIANFLYKKGYNYMYEKSYPKELERGYIPDFTIMDNGREIYIEYYGLINYKKDGIYTKEEIDAYNRQVEKKRDLHRKYGTDLIELYPNTSYVNELKIELDKREVKEVRRSDEEVFYKLLYTSQEAQFYKFIKLVLDFIDRFKERGYKLSDFDYLLDKTKDERLKRRLEFIRPIYKYYEYTIHNAKEIDFNDMINYAYLGMEKVKNTHTYLEYDYIIIDEYQDISRQRYNFAKRLSDLFGAKIVAVGDDWQAIFSFSGSDIEMFTNFYKLFGYASIVKITKTYRNSQELIDVAGDFVSKNKEQFAKKLISDKHLENPVEVIYYDERNAINKVSQVYRIICDLYRENPKGKILLLGRYNADINNFIDSEYFNFGPDDKIICKDCSANVEFLNIHKSKGLGYDNVILLNAINGMFGFPSKIEDDDLLKLMDEQKPLYIEYPEERRLFYVALTRTKNKVYIMCPYTYDNRSSFIREIVEYENVKEYIGNA